MQLSNRAICLYHLRKYQVAWTTLCVSRLALLVYSIDSDSKHPAVTDNNSVTNKVVYRTVTLLVNFVNCPWHVFMDANDAVCTERCHSTRIRDWSGMTQSLNTATSHVSRHVWTCEFLSHSSPLDSVPVVRLLCWWKLCTAHLEHALQPIYLHTCADQICKNKTTRV